MANDFRFIINLYGNFDSATQNLFKYPNLMEALLKKFNEVQQNGEVFKRINTQKGIVSKQSWESAEALDYLVLLLLENTDETWALCNQCGENYIKNYGSSSDTIQLLVEGNGVGFYNVFTELYKSCNFQKIEIVPANTAAKVHFGGDYRMCIPKTRSSNTTARKNYLTMSRSELNQAGSESSVKVQKCIVNSRGEKAIVGDTIKMNLLVTTGLGDEGTITAIEDDRIKLDEIVVQPIAGILDFTIVQTAFISSMPSMNAF